MQPLRTCSHIKETGDICNSVAAKDQKYCPHHLRYHARQLRMAQLAPAASAFTSYSRRWTACTPCNPRSPNSLKLWPPT